MSSTFFMCYIIRVRLVGTMLPFRIMSHSHKSVFQNLQICSELANHASCQLKEPSSFLFAVLKRPVSFLIKSSHSEPFMCSLNFNRLSVPDSNCEHVVCVTEIESIITAYGSSITGEVCLISNRLVKPSYFNISQFLQCI